MRTGEQVTSALLEKGFEVIALDLDEDIATTLLHAKPDVVFIALHGKLTEKMGVFKGFWKYSDFRMSGPAYLPVLLP